MAYIHIAYEEWQLTSAARGHATRFEKPGGHQMLCCEPTHNMAVLASDVADPTSRGVCIFISRITSSVSEGCLELTGTKQWSF